MELRSGGAPLVKRLEREHAPVAKAAPWVVSLEHEDRGLLALALSNQADEARKHGKKKLAKRLLAATQALATGDAQGFDKHRKPAVKAIRHCAAGAHHLGHILLSSKFDALANGAAGINT